MNHRLMAYNYAVRLYGSGKKSRVLVANKVKELCLLWESDRVKFLKIVNAHGR